jgi:enamine deaminase RidA (YjgF/YER057c/UK114 family)
VLVGRPSYLAGRTGHDLKTRALPAEPADEVRAILDQMKTVLGQENMTMDDLVSVQVFCTDVKLYDTFNAVYRTYFKRFPRAPSWDRGRSWAERGSRCRGSRRRRYQ